MKSGKMHSLLKRQLKKCFGDAFSIPEEWRGFINAVNDAYHESDMDRNMLERSLELSSQELLQANSEMRAIFEAVPDIFFRVDISGTILDCKTGNISDLFVPPQDLMGKKIYDIPLTSVARKFRTALTDALHSKTAVSFDYSLELHGREQHYETRLIPLLEDQAVVIVRNVTERTRAENALRESERKYRLLTEKMTDIVWIANMDLRTIYVTPSVQAVLGFTQEERMQQTVDQQFTPDSLAVGMEAMARELALEEQGTADPDRTATLVLEYYHKDGSTRWMETIMSGLRDEEGTLVGLHGVSRDITKRKRAEVALRESEASYRQLFDNAPAGIYRVDFRTGRLLRANDVLCEYLGCSREEILQINPFDLLTEESKTLFLARLKNMSLGKEVPEAVEYEIVTKSGRKLWIHLHNRNIYDAEGHVIAADVVAHDITERKKAEQALYKSEQKYRMAASYHEQLNTIAITFTESFGAQELLDKITDSLLRLSGAVATMFTVYDDATHTLTPVAVSTDPVAGDMLHSVFRPLMAKPIHCSENNMTQMRTRIISRRKNLHELSGGEIPWEISDMVMDAVGCRRLIALAISYADELLGICIAFISKDRPLLPDNVLKTFVYLSGMTIKRNRAEDFIRKSEERYRTIFESTATANIIVAEDTTILMANHNFADLVGYSKEELEGKMKWTELIVSEDMKRVRLNQMMRLTNQTFVPSTYEIHAKTRDGTVRELFMSVAVIPETRETVASLIDLTERKKLETQLIQAQKMESVGRLAGGVAHDFNNMLSVIIGNTEMAITRITRNDPLYKSLQDILNAGRRSADLTRQLLAFARKQTVSPKVINLNDAVAGMLKMLQRLISENIELGWYPGHNLWKVLIDPSQVDQILANLTVNARDSIKKTGRISLETSNITIDGTYNPERPECVEGDYVALTVSDDGCGMDRETLLNIFEPFFTTKTEGKGTGLGLATVYGIVRQNNGFINVYSEPNQGTTFRIYLPRYRAEASEIDDEPKLEVQGGTETILIAEDDESVLDLSKAMLEVMGYRVLTAKSNTQALRIVKDYDGNIDLLLTDVVMPHMNGKELSELIRTVKPDLKCLYMSGYTADVIAHQGILDEHVNFLSKPFSLKELAAKVREVLDGIK